MKYLSLLPFLAAVAIVAYTGAIFKPGEWYLALNKPVWTPPGWLFGPVWTVLYAMIAVAGWMVWNKVGFAAVFWIWVLQLVLNMAWSWIMFSQHQIGLALFDIALLLATIVVFIAFAWPVDRNAALLFLPYVAWVGFATALNASIWRLNG